MGEVGTGGSRDEDPLWYESMPDDWSWACLWSGYVRCMCGGIRTINLEAQCSACGKAWVEVEPAPLVTRDTDGYELRVKPDLAGAEGRYEDWVYLSMLEREWRRPVDAGLYGSVPENSRPSSRAIVVLLFWSYFETRIGRLFRETTKTVPGEVMDHLLERHSSVGARMDRLYRVVFSSTYRADLNDLGYGHVASLLKQVEQCRNKFTHGHPEAIDDALVEELVAGLKEEHEAWIAVFNKRLRESRGQLARLNSK